MIPWIYLHYLRLAKDAARDLGYAIAVHGSMTRDLDLVAIPWTEQAAPAEQLVAKLASWFKDEHDYHQIVTGPEAKPHGRMAWTIPVGAGLYVDLSVVVGRMAMPTAEVIQWAATNDPLVRAGLTSGLSMEAIIDALARDRLRLIEDLIRYKQEQPCPATPAAAPAPGAAVRPSPPASIATTPSASPPTTPPTA